MPIPQLLIHHPEDNVAVVVVEQVDVGREIRAVVVADQSERKLCLEKAVAIGHKVALCALVSGETAIKYGQDIGRITQAIALGEHVHTHNLKTKRW